MEVLVAGAYAYTPAIWPPLVAAVLLATIGLYARRRRDVPGALPLAAGSLFATLWLLGMALEAAAVTLASKITWHTFQAVVQLPTVTSTACFSLEYAHPGRWLTRRNLALLALPPLLFALIIATGHSELIWPEFVIGPDGSLERPLTPVGAIFVAYGIGLLLVNATALIWLFIHSPQHRRPVALMLFGSTAARLLYAAHFVDLSWLPLSDPVAASLVLPWATYFIALFGFHILDPLPTARRAVIEQMHAGMVVFDTAWRVASLNPAAQKMIGVSDRLARGKTWQQLAPGSDHPLDLPAANAQPAGAEIELPDVTLGTGAGARYYAPTLSELRDFRGPLMGYLLVLHDMTEQRRALAQLLEQQRASAMLQERERLARELHDELSQVLGYVAVQARAARDQVDRDHKEVAHEYLTQLMTAAQEAHTDVREYILGARLTSDAGFDLFVALEQYLRRFAANYGIRAGLTVTPELRSADLDMVVQVQLLRIIQEALTNTRKHASARQVEVHFERADGRARVMICDDGAGFDPEPDAGDGGHFGLGFMRERALEMGGTCAIVSTPGRGTQVIVEAPLHRDGQTR